MDGSQPLDESTFVALSLPYAVSEEWQLAQLGATGELPARRYVFEGLLAELPAHLRARAAKLWKALRDWDHGDEERPVPELAKPPADPAEIIAAYEDMLAADELHVAELQRAHEARQAEARAESERFQTEMRGWVAAHGSRRVKLALERGYKVTAAYLEERLKHELPGFRADANKQAEWQERASPSLKALEREEEALAAVRALGQDHPVRIVWLTEGPRGWTYVTPEEAILISGYLGRYDLYRSVHEVSSFSEDDIPF